MLCRPWCGQKSNLRVSSDRFEPKSLQKIRVSKVSRIQQVVIPSSVSPPTPLRSGHSLGYSRSASSSQTKAHRSPDYQKPF